MNNIVWKKYSKSPKAVIATSPGYAYYYELYSAYKEAYEWCMQNDIFCRGDNASVIKFTNEKDLFTFLLRWS